MPTEVVIMLPCIPSYGDNRLTGSYERLEYIGDAVLDYLVTVYVYGQAGQDVGPGRITDIRSALVNNNMFASVLVDNNLHTFILMAAVHILNIAYIAGWLDAVAPEEKV